jgi:hypothetical protein
MNAHELMVEWNRLTDEMVAGKDRRAARDRITSALSDLARGTEIRELENVIVEASDGAGGLSPDGVRKVAVAMHARGAR